MPVTPWLKWLYLSEETVKQMRWYKALEYSCYDINGSRF
jgi:hypothetical protein